MKSATRILIISICTLFVGLLLYPPWVDSYSREFLGFYFITGEDIDSIYRAQIDYAKLIIIMLCVSFGISAIYFVVTASIFSGIIALTKRILRFFVSIWIWLGKNWLWFVLAVALIKAFAHIPISTAPIAQNTLARLELSKTYEEDIPVRFGSLKINHENVLLYNNHSLAPEIRGDRSLSVVSTYILGNSDVVLIQNNGGSACPALFHFVTVSNSGVKATSEFGTCTDLIDVKQKGSSIFVTMPGFRGPFEPLYDALKAAEEKHIYLYKAGVITKK